MFSNNYFLNQKLYWCGVYTQLLYIIFVLKMSDRHDSSTQMIDLNQRILDQTNQIKAITRVAEATNDTSGNILKELDHQRGQI